MNRRHLDLVAIVLIALVPPAFYVWELGFYIDDWGFMWALRTSADQSWTGLYRSLAAQPALAVRPLQIVWLIAGYKFSPDAILPIHLANQLLFAAAGAVLFIALRRVERLRPAAFALVALYLSLPTFVTARYWWANHQSGVSVLMFALAVLFTRRWLQGEGRHASLAGAALAAAATLLAYALPAFILPIVPMLLALADGRRPRDLWRDRRAIAATGAIVLPLVAAALFKFAIAYGAAPPDSAGGFLADAAWLYARAGFTSMWTHGIAAPYYAARIAAGPFASPLSLVPGIMVAALVWWRTPPGTDSRRLPPAWTMVAAGAAVFALAYVPFLANFWFGGSPFGTANRAHVGGAMGVALMFVGAVSRVAASRPAVGRALLGACCGAGAMTQVNIGHVWGGAWREQEAIVDELVARALPVPAGGSLLIYGHCPYFGAAPVFPPDAWLGARLAMRTGLPRFHANTIVAGTGPGASGIEVRDANHLGDLPPGETLPYRGAVIYDLRDHRRYAIESRAEADAFFAAHPASEATGCTYRGEAGLPLW